MTHVAIIGAGLSGLTAANILKGHADVTLFEKARGVGGRMSTRRAEPYFFDHGAQFFKVRGDAFKAFISPMIKDGVIKRWDARFVEINDRVTTQKRQWGEHHPHYVGAPGMNAVARYLAEGLRVRAEVRVGSIKRRYNKWYLEDELGNALGEYDWVISAVPAEQAQALLVSAPSCCKAVSNVKMKGCFSMMLGFEKPLALSFDAALVCGEDISWIAVNSSKPARNNAFCLVVHSTNNWADEHIDADHFRVMEHLCKQTSEIIGHDVSIANHKAIHCWRFANIEKQTGEKYCIDTANNIAVCGDWFIQGRVEAAFTSGFEMANNIVRFIQSGIQDD